MCPFIKYWKVLLKNCLEYFEKTFTLLWKMQLKTRFDNETAYMRQQFLDNSEGGMKMALISERFIIIVYRKHTRE